MATIGITGSTGRLGGRVARRLAAAGVAQRLIVRDPLRAPQLVGAEVVHGPYGDGHAARRALQGLDLVLMVSASESPNRVAEHLAFVDAAVQAGVGHLVYTSFVGASPTATFTLARDHWATEEHIRASGLDFTFLRDNLYADFVPLMASEDGVIRGPAGTGSAAVVAQDDIADSATAVVRDPRPHVARTYELTGPESLSVADLASILSRAAGKPIRYVDETLTEAYASRGIYGAPDWQIDAWVSTYTAIAAGELARVTDDVPNLTGHPATSFEAVLRVAMGDPT